jgi:HNH endonuclease
MGTPKRIPTVAGLARIRKAQLARWPQRSTNERFWANVEEPFDAHNDCWIWKGKPTKKGYGRFKATKGWRPLAHRYSWEFFNGPVPSGQELHHNCKNRLCVNPTHLESTPHPNHLHGHSLERTHCKKGHPLSRSNLRIWAGERRCAICESIRKRLARQKKRHSL